jgi:outer membrane biosynthesis protein TonB
MLDMLGQPPKSWQELRKETAAHLFSAESDICRDGACTIKDYTTHNQMTFLALAYALNICLTVKNSNPDVEETYDPLYAAEVMVLPPKDTPVGSGTFLLRNAAPRHWDVAVPNGCDWGASEMAEKAALAKKKENDDRARQKQEEEQRKKEKGLAKEKEKEDRRLAVVKLKSDKQQAKEKAAKDKEEHARQQKKAKEKAKGDKRLEVEKPKRDKQQAKVKATEEKEEKAMPKKAACQLHKSRPARNEQQKPKRFFIRQTSRRMMSLETRCVLYSKIGLGWALTSHRRTCPTSVNSLHFPS